MKVDKDKAAGLLSELKATRESTARQILGCRPGPHQSDLKRYLQKVDRKIAMIEKAAAA